MPDIILKDVQKLSPLKVAVVFGTRPEAIKLAPLIKCLRDNAGRFQSTVVVTAQHREMLDQVLQLFSIKPDYDLDVLRPRQTLAHVTASGISGIDAVFAATHPDFVVVQGDTSTTFVGALAAFYNRISVAHVEAGLRTQQKYNPFPEEINRRLSSVLADVHLAPTAAARNNLLAEGIAEEKIWVTGNTIIDTLMDVLQWERRCDHPVLDRVAAQKHRMIFVTTHRRENQGRPQEQICLALLELIRRFRDILVVFPVHLSPSVRDTVLPRLREQDRLVLLEPIDYFETVHFMKAAHLILTDSGGIQEEAPTLGKPALVMRNWTERSEGIESGSARLVGTDPAKIVETASELLSVPDVYRRMAESVSPYGDGKACERILQILEFISGRAPSPEPFA